MLTVGDVAVGKVAAELEVETALATEIFDIELWLANTIKLIFNIPDAILQVEVINVVTITFT